MTAETKRALIVVRTYPTPAKKGVEVSCTAAITDKGEWLRLFPVPYRRLPTDQQFSKYQWIDVTVIRASDPRPESHKLSQDAIRIVSDVLPTDHAWQSRKEVVFPLKSDSLCAIRKRRSNYGFPTLGIFKPTIERLLIEPTNELTWTEEQLAILKQGDLFESEPVEELEKIPFDFRYQFRCSDPQCNGHKMKCTDWEMGQSWRKWRREYGDGWETAFREKYERQMIEELDTHFYVGTLNQYPDSWIVVGLFYPPKPKALPLFD